MKTALSLFAIIFLAACASNVNPLQHFEPAAEVSGRPQSEYRIQVGDQLDIKFFYNSELNESVQVRPDGKISLQLLGEIIIYNMTPSELENMLKEKYSPHLATAEVAVIVRAFNMQKVYVDGEVARPGALPLVGFMTVLQSISQAGGVKSNARTGEVLVIRRGEGGKPVVLKVNVNRAAKGKDMSQDVYLAPFDIVYVPRTAVGDVNQFVDNYIRKNIPIGVGTGFSLF